MSYPTIKLTPNDRRRMAKQVPGVSGGRGIKGWRASEADLRFGKIVEYVSLSFVTAFFLAAIVHVLTLVGGAEMSWLRLTAQIAGGVSFLVAHFVPLVVDPNTGGRSRVGLWSLLLFWLTFAFLVAVI